MGYRGKITEQQRARELRAESWTLQEIADELGVAKSSVSLWVRDVAFDPKPRSTARHRAPNALQRRKAAEIDEMRSKGAAAVGQLSDREFLVAGVALYAGEGNKTDGTVGLANTDTQIIAFFCAWLRRFFDIDETRLRVTLYLHEGLDLEAAERHWSRTTAIPTTQFTKPYRAVVDGSRRRTKHLLGCATVRYADAATHRLIMGMVTALFGPAARTTLGGEPSVPRPPWNQRTRS